MDLKVEIRYYNRDFPWLCFRHASVLAIEGFSIETDIDDYSSEYSLIHKVCLLCEREAARKLFSEA